MCIIRFILFKVLEAVVDKLDNLNVKNKVYHRKKKICVSDVDII